MRKQNILLIIPIMNISILKKKKNRIVLIKIMSKYIQDIIPELQMNIVIIFHLQVQIIN